MASSQTLRRVALITLLPLGALLLSGCWDDDTRVVFFRLGGAITGLNSEGLVLGNGTNRLPVSAGASAFTMTDSVREGTGYSVTVVTQPTGLTCTVSHGSGTMPASNVSSVVVTCAENAYSLGGTVTGLTLAGLVLSNGSDRLTVAANATSFTLPAKVTYSSHYAVAVDSQPVGLTCTLSQNVGTMPASDVDNVEVACTDTAYALGGSITGLTAGGLVLQNGSDRLMVAPNATQFTMPAAVAYTSHYAITVATQPSGLSCTVTQGTGTMPAAAFAGVMLSCAPRQWTWISGAGDSPNVAGVYGVKGTPAASNMPGSRTTATSWTDAAGNLWLFGGYAYNATNTQGVTDDLWKYAPATGEWTWVGGSSTDFTAAGVYGTQGVASPNNRPGVRENATSWTDTAGNLWLFGGDGLSAGHNDLWAFSPASGEWTWVSGSSTGNASGIYGTQGVAAASNMPGARAQAVSWVDGAGNFWLFGGSDANGNALNDLWQYNPNSGEWTWVSGSSGINAAGVIGTQGIAAAANTPGARTEATAWHDGAGNLWLFGGLGYNSNGVYSYLNDLWRFDPTSGQWAWIGGSNVGNAAGVYGTQGAAAAGDVPGARFSAVPWIDGLGNLWLFGGYGLDTNGSLGQLNDLWQYNPSSGEWTWVGGADSTYAVSVYGTQGTPAAANVPGSDQYMISWTDTQGNFWLFGGYGNSATSSGSLNTLWKY